jgi:FixJ family two-component response regulator
VSSPVIAVVDDDPAVSNSLKFSLEVEGFLVHLYRSGAELLDTGELVACNCFVIDQKLLPMSGLEVIAKLRSRRISAPAILITSHPNAALIARAAMDGTPIVEKPLLGNALVDKIREVCRRAA